ncbi:MAG: hypothetical protein SPE84_02205 [Bullifex sp.]|nr:hypothetical protein [Bullifex sp.]
MRRKDKILLAVNAAFTLVMTALTILFLPERISLMLSGGELKSRLYLPLLSAVPLACTYIVSVTGKSTSVSYAFFLGVSLYSVAVFLNTSGLTIPYEALILLILAMGTLYLALSLLRPESRIKVSLKYVTSKSVYDRLQKLASAMFFTITAELIIIALLSLMNAGNASAALFVVLITGFIFSLVILKSSIRSE